MTSENDPYVTFRKREIKSTRKTRRTDAQCLQKYEILRRDLEDVTKLLDLVGTREKMRKEMILLDQLIFEQRANVRSQRKYLGMPDEIPDEKPKKKVSSPV